MLNWLSWFFDDLFYWLALIALIGGAAAYALSYLVGFLPMLKPHAFIMKVVGLVLIILGGYYVADHHGYERRVAEDKAEIERLNAEAREKEVAVKKTIAKLQSNLTKAKDENKAKQVVTNARIDSGELRIPSSCSVQTTTDSSSGNGDSPSESERTFLKSVNDITIEANNRIEERNTCIRQYNEIREKFNEVGN